jgi:hypothetical protein
VGEVRRNHGGNKAVWDTVGVQSDNRANVGKQPSNPPVQETVPPKNGPISSSRP